MLAAAGGLNSPNEDAIADLASISMSSEEEDVVLVDDVFVSLFVCV